MTDEERKKFLYRECERFDGSMTYEEYEAAIKKYLMLCDWRYSEEGAEERVMKDREYIQGEFKKKMTVGDVAIDIGYCCG
ncbi:MAG: hypothetical protein LUC38_02825 [Oscillospiraceae bacterium]|nr:hypothetical protein [Ruminococcus sp.]MCD8344878.1 hypothetical protein [Oscillospiraceae bacterium]